MRGSVLLQWAKIFVVGGWRGKRLGRPVFVIVGVCRCGAGVFGYPV